MKLGTHPRWPLHLPLGPSGRQPRQTPHACSLWRSRAADKVSWEPPEGFGDRVQPWALLDCGHREGPHPHSRNECTCRAARDRPPSAPWAPPHVCPGQDLGTTLRLSWFQVPPGLTLGGRAAVSSCAQLRDSVLSLGPETPWSGFPPTIWAPRSGSSEQLVCFSRQDLCCSQSASVYTPAVPLLAGRFL